VRFWDASAILPLVVEQDTSRSCRTLRRADPAVVVWALSRVEACSAIHRLAREGLLSREQVAQALKRTRALFDRFTEVVAFDAVRERAERVLAVHPLAAADALQLAAALTLTSDRPRRRGFVCADDRLARAAESEGFDVITPK
jgi:hypothetical protein